MGSTPPTDTSSLLSRLPGVRALKLELADRRPLGGTLLELVLTGDLAGFEPEPGNDIMLAVPVEGGDGSFRRRYSIRRVDAPAGELVLWIDTAADGPGSRWAGDAPLGSRIEAVGPRGKVLLDAMADWHLFVGDLSFLSAAFSMAESIEPPGQAIFVVEVDDEAAAVQPSLPEGIGLTFVVIERDGRALDDPAGLLAGLGAIELPEDEGCAYVGGELGVVAALRRALIERGFSPEAVRSKPYWRLGVANLAHGEPKKDDPAG